jgi:cysteine desulfurase
LVQNSHSAVIVREGIIARIEDLLNYGAESFMIVRRIWVAARRLIEECTRDAARVAECRNSFLAALLGRVRDITINGTEPKHPGQVNIRVAGVDAEDLVANVQPRLALSTGAACSSGIPEPSHVLRALGLNATAASQCIRVGFGRTSNAEAAREAAAILASTIEDIRSNSALARSVDAF